MSTFNGCGSRFYGKCQFRDDGTHVTTEWFTLFYFPIVPLRSMRVAREPSGDSSFLGFHTFCYDIDEELPIYWNQVWRVYGFVGSVALGYLWLLYRGMDAMGYFSGKESLTKFIFLLFLVAAPWLFLWFLRWRGSRNLLSSE